MAGPPCGQERAPNGLFIVLDNPGVAELARFGAAVKAPPFDRLAANVLRYRASHTTALSTPGRDCFLIGRNHLANGVGTISETGTGFPGYNCSIPTESGFLLGMLLPHCYATFAIGKWHLMHASDYASATSRPRPRSARASSDGDRLGKVTGTW